MAREIRGTSPSGTLYARIISPTGLWWDGTTFEAYDAGSYTDYDVAMTEQGASGVYVADFPTGITTGGTYEYFVHRQAGGSPAEGDLVVNTGKVDWTGTTSVSAASGSQTAADWLAYVLRRGFKRTDKDTEIYEATTDAIQELRRRFMFDEAEVDDETTDTISVLGDFKIDVESDFGLLCGIVVEDDNTATDLEIIAKAKFDRLYPDINVTGNTGYPKHGCLYAGQVLIGPIPDRVDYVYRVSYSQRAGTISSATTGVPFTSLYRDMLAEFVLSRLYRDLEEFDIANIHQNEGERLFLQATHRETVNSASHVFTQRPTNF